MYVSHLLQGICICMQCSLSSPNYPKKITVRLICFPQLEISYFFPRF